MKTVEDIYQEYDKLKDLIERARKGEIKLKYRGVLLTQHSLDRGSIEIKIKTSDYEYDGNTNPSHQSIHLSIIGQGYCVYFNYYVKIRYNDLEVVEEPKTFILDDCKYTFDNDWKVWSSNDCYIRMDLNDIARLHKAFRCSPAIDSLTVGPLNISREQLEKIYNH